jgi:transcriptional regulator with XRE-family HTH domain
MEEENEEKKQYLFTVHADIGRAVAELRTAKGLTVEEAAELSGLTEKRFAAVERGRILDRPHMMARLVEALGGRLAIVPEESPEDAHCSFIEFDE